MDRFLKAGLIMQFIQAIMVGVLAVIYMLLIIPWTLSLLAMIIFAIFNVFSFILIIVGIFTSLFK